MHQGLISNKRSMGALKIFHTLRSSNISYFIHLAGTTSGRVVTLEIGRREVPGSSPGRACRPSRSEFSVVFSENRVNMG